MQLSWSRDATRGTLHWDACDDRKRKSPLIHGLQWILVGSASGNRTRGLRLKIYQPIERNQSLVAIFANPVPQDVPQLLKIGLLERFDCRRERDGQSLCNVARLVLAELPEPGGNVRLLTWM